MSHGFKYVRLVKGRYPRFRTKETGDVALPGPIGSPDFLREYAALLERRDARQQQPQGAIEGSWSAIIDAYLASPEYDSLADRTQDDYTATCEVLREELGDQPFRLTTLGMLKMVRDDLADKPRKAHKIKQMASRLYSWAAENSIVPQGYNPAAGLKRLKRKGGEKEISVWSDLEIEWIFAAADAAVLTPLMIFLYTGQREKDVPSMRWNQYQGEIVRCRASKTGHMIDIPCHPVLRAYLDKLRANLKVVDLAGHICLTDAGQPWTLGQLNGRIRRLVERVAKVHPIPGSRSPHGLRYAAGSRMIEGGATHAEAAEVLGHHTFKMALKYAGQRVRAAAAIAAMPEASSPRNGA